MIISIGSVNSRTSIYILPARDMSGPYRDQNPSRGFFLAQWLNGSIYTPDVTCTVNLYQIQNVEHYMCTHVFSTTADSNVTEVIEINEQNVPKE